MTLPSPQASEGNTNARRASEETRKLRSACNACHGAKVRCSGGMPCSRCARDGMECRYSYRAKLGKPKGSVNKKTLERLKRMREEQGSSEAQSIQVPTPQTASDCAIQGRNCSPSSTQPITTISSTISPPAADLSSLQPVERTDSDKPSIFPLDTPPYQMPLDPLLDFGGSTADDFEFLNHQQDHSEIPELTGAGLDTQYLNFDIESTQSCHEDGEDEQGQLHTSQDSSPWLSPSVSNYQLPMDRQPQRGKSLGRELISPQPLFYQQNEAAVASCNCFHRLSDHLCHLQTISGLDRVVRLDTVLILSQQVLPSISRFLHCSFCCSNTQGFFLTSMLLSKLFELYITSSAPCQEPISQLDIRLGNYQPSCQLATSIKCLLIRHHLRDVKSIVESFDQRANRSSGNEADSEYLKLQVRKFKQEVVKLEKQTGGSGGIDCLKQNSIPF
ncbi:hypothetical protein L228DRAFT_244781 [Xylona heveae TC161]|uniref:Zn(2)-C6 fungal-type domain-containing protein n=1 Tax=Xylona heveae (strain CBS 132557 / TC161) TaxID=1328760 RepID=A0A161TDJ4_XYLHT|nr:hypothetical protein L228DRAFT_244781 [Xylona heveae TC161]KZF23917.1 hypothetical protein L228DRAFT_244781 [Xylona heveae TC161]